MQCQLCKIPTLLNIKGTLDNTKRAHFLIFQKVLGGGGHRAGLYNVCTYVSYVLAKISPNDANEKNSNRYCRKWKFYYSQNRMLIVLRKLETM